jgi:hypothetical protein
MKDIAMKVIGKAFIKNKKPFKELDIFSKIVIELGDIVFFKNHEYGVVVSSYYEGKSAIQKQNQHVVVFNIIDFKFYDITLFELYSNAYDIR